MISETARMLRDTADRIIARHRPQPADEAGWSAAAPALWAAVEEAGLTLALVPQRCDGMDLSWSDAAVLPHLWGYRAAPLPIIDMLLAARIARSCGLDERWAGCSVALAGGGDIDAAWWPGAQGVLVLAQDGRVSGFAVEDVDPHWSHDLADQPRIRFAPKAPTIDAVADSAVEVGRIGHAARLFNAAALLGAMEQAYALALDYTKLRTQFGQPLARFQAMQRLLMQMASEIAATRALLTVALADIDAGRCNALRIHAVKVRAAQAATMVAAHAHQAMGAIGFTEEHELHRFTKRLWSWRDDWARQADAEEAVGRLAIAAGGDRLWPLLADEPDAAPMGEAAI